MVNIDTVYQRVLTLANKEQRGYITPVEFNLFANQAQMDIFEQYFHDLKLFKQVPGSTDIHADSVSILKEKTNIFHYYAKELNFETLNSDGEVALGEGYEDYIYRITEVSVDYGSGRVKCEEVEAEDVLLYSNSSLFKESELRPIFYRYSNSSNIQLNQEQIKILPVPEWVQGEENVYISYIKKPSKAEWNGVQLGNTLMYEPGISNNFDLHVSEETKLVVKILQLASIAMKDAELYQVAEAEDIKNTQQEKQ